MPEREPSPFDQFDPARDGAALCAQFEKVIRTKAARLAESASQAEDIQQEGFMALWRLANEFDPGRGVRFSSFAYGRLRGAMQDAARAYAKESNAVELSAEPPDRSSLPGQLRHMLASQIADLISGAGLTEPERLLVNLRYMQGCTFAEIAERMLISIRHSQRIEASALSKIRRVLELRGVKSYREAA